MAGGHSIPFRSQPLSTTSTSSLSTPPLLHPIMCTHTWYGGCSFIQFNVSNVMPLAFVTFSMGDYYRGCQVSIVFLLSSVVPLMLRDLTALCRAILQRGKARLHESRMQDELGPQAQDGAELSVHRGKSIVPDPMRGVIHVIRSKLNFTRPMQYATDDRKVVNKFHFKCDPCTERERSSRAYR